MKKNQKNSGFKTPENYFESFNNRLKEHLEDKGSVLPRRDGLKVPEEYFDSVNEKINARLQEQPTKVIGLHTYRKYYYAAAAIAALFILVLGFQQIGQKELTFDTLASTDIEDYLNNTDLGLSSYEIAEVVVIDDKTINTILDEEILDENIMDYLDENVDDFDELNLELDE